LNKARLPPGRLFAMDKAAIEKLFGHLPPLLMTLDEAAVELEQIAEWIDDAQGRTTPTIPTPDLYRADSHRLQAFISIWLEHAYTLLLASEEGIRSALSQLHPKDMATAALVLRARAWQIRSIPDRVIQAGLEVRQEKPLVLAAREYGPRIYAHALGSLVLVQCTQYLLGIHGP
jgi:hypothetical protein